MIKGLQISVQRGERKLLDRVQFIAKPGEVTVILGPNGAGKTTLMRVLSGSLQPDEGHVEFCGTPLNGYSPSELAKRRAVLPQESNLTFGFRVEEVVLLGRTPHMQGRAKESDLEIVQKALEWTDMLPMRDRLYTTLSGGEKQRVHLARALTQIWETKTSADTGYLFLDEPVSALDLKYQHATLHMAHKLSREGIAVIAILHDLNLALRYGDVAYLLKEGRVAEHGSVDSVLQSEPIHKVFDVEAEIVTTQNSERHIVTQLNL